MTARNVKRRVRWLALGGVATVATLLWPGPAQASTTLGGYTGVAYASVVHVQVYEPTIPIPATPQGDVSIAYSKATLDTGPSTRATASYLWPGDVVGDGFDQLLKQPGKTYPVQVNSRFPATDSAPEKNAAQLTDGNGMSTATDGDTTKAAVTLLGLAGPDTNLLSGVLKGVDQLLGKKPSPTPSAAPPAVPLPVSAALAGVVTAQYVTSSTKIVLGEKAVTSSAHAAASNIALLGGLITIEGLDVSSSVVSDGTRATPEGTARLAGVKVAGIDLGISDKGLNLGAGSVKLPVLSDTVTKALRNLGIAVDTLPVARSVDGPTGRFSAQALVISVDTGPLKSALNGPLGAIVSLLPQNSQSQLSVLLNLGPKLVLTIGDVTADATSAPGYDGGTGGGGGSGVPSGSSSGVGTGVTTGDSGTPGGAASGGEGGTGLPAGDAGPPATAAPQSLGVPMQPTAALHLPPLGAVPRLLILGALALSALLGWGIRTAGAILLGDGRRCSYGLATGVPDLRKG